jgi:hypothetical protein
MSNPPDQPGRPEAAQARYRQTAPALPQLPNPVTEEQLEELVADDQWWMQGQLEGKRLLIHKRGRQVRATDTRGRPAILPQPIAKAVRGLSVKSFCWTGSARAGRTAPRTCLS